MDESLLAPALEHTQNEVANFPELYLSRYFASRGEEVPIYCFSPAGVQAVLEHYRALASRFDLDALVLVDGGTDSLLRGDEPGLGSPGEDMASLGAAHCLELPVRLLMCLGFGIDSHHHVCHHYVLEAAADLTDSEDFLGASPSTAWPTAASTEMPC